MNTHAHAHPHAHGETEPEHEHVLPIGSYIAVYVALMVLLVATVGAAYIDLGWFNFTLTMLIAALKAVMILLIFMHVRYSDRLTWVFSSAAFLWLAILIAMSLNDYFTRGLLNIPGK
jgi:cytochrome c oxidase subunit 4